MKRLFKKYREKSAMFAWARALERYLSDDLERASKALEEARKVNPYVEAYLRGKKRLPRYLPDYYTPGEESEAVVCIEELGRAWECHPEALTWLKSSK